MTSNTDHLDRNYKPNGFCPKCGYAIDPGICPECGSDVPAEKLRSSNSPVHYREYIKRICSVLLFAAAVYGITLIPYVRLVPTVWLIDWSAQHGANWVRMELDRRWLAKSMTIDQIERLVQAQFTVSDLSILRTNPASEDVFACIKVRPGPGAYLPPDLRNKSMAFGPFLPLKVTDIEISLSGKPPFDNIHYEKIEESVSTGVQHFVFNLGPLAPKGYELELRGVLELEHSFWFRHSFERTAITNVCDCSLEQTLASFMMLPGRPELIKNLHLEADGPAVPEILSVIADRKTRTPFVGCIYIRAADNGEYRRISNYLISEEAPRPLHMLYFISTKEQERLGQAKAIDLLIVGDPILSMKLGHKHWLDARVEWLNVPITAPKSAGPIPPLNAGPKPLPGMRPTSVTDFTFEDALEFSKTD